MNKSGIIWKLSKYIFGVLLFKNFYKYALILLSVLFSTSILLPILQAEWMSFTKNEEIVQKSNNFDFYFQLPNRKRFLKLKQESGDKLVGFESVHDVVDKIVQKKKQSYEFSSLLVYKANLIDFEDKKFFSIETSAFAEKADPESINKVVLTAGREPAKGSNSEVVINSKFAKKNKILLGQEIEVVDLTFVVVGFADAANNLSLNFQTTMKVEQSLGIDKKEDDLYYHYGIFYVNEESFLNIYKLKKFNNFENILYLKFPPEVNLQAKKNDFLIAIQKEINYDPKVVFFQSDLSSGLKKFLITFEIYILIVVYFLIFSFLLFWLCFLNLSAYKKEKKFRLLVNTFGFSHFLIALSFFLINFFALFLISIGGFFFTAPLSDYFFSYNDQLSFLSFEVVVFYWEFFLIQIVLFPLLWALFSSFFLFYKMKDKNLLYSWQGDKRLFNYENTDTFFYRIGWKKLPFWFFSSPKIKVFLLFVFQDFGKKILLLGSNILFFVFFFLLVFTKVSSSNFIDNQWSFLNKDVKSFTKLSDHISIDQNNLLKSEVDFVSEQNLNEQNLQKISSLDQLNLKKTGCIFSAQRRDDLLACGLQKQFIDQSIESTKLRKYMQQFGIEKIYFNNVPYQKEKEILVLVGKVNNQNLSSEIYFMPAKWPDYFQITDLESKVNDFQFQANGKLGTDSAGFQYVLVPEHWKKKGYKLNDLITFNNISFDWLLLSQQVKFRIAGFISNDKLIRNTLFTDYDYLLQEKIVSSTTPEQKKPYNFIFSATEKKHLKKYLVLNLNKVDIEKLSVFQQDQNFDLNFFSFTNLESLTLSEFYNLSNFHLEIYQIYFLFLIAFSALFLFFLLLIFLNTAFSSHNKIATNLVVFGYHFKESLWGFSLVTIACLLLGFLIAFLLAFALFIFLSNFFATVNIYLFAVNIWDYFFYGLGAVLFVFLVTLFYNFSYPKKSKIKAR